MDSHLCLFFLHSHGFTCLLKTCNCTCTLTCFCLESFGAFIGKPLKLLHNSEASVKPSVKSCVQHLFHLLGFLLRSAHMWWWWQSIIFFYFDYSILLRCSGCRLAGRHKNFKLWHYAVMIPPISAASLIMSISFKFLETGVDHSPCHKTWYSSFCHHSWCQSFAQSVPSKFSWKICCDELTLSL